MRRSLGRLPSAAITYYVAGLVNYFAKGLKAGGAKIEPETATALAIPLIVLAIAYVLKRTRQKLKLDHEE
ncbi:MAG: DUF3422 family protein [Hyphomicrobium sp.]